MEPRFIILKMPLNEIYETPTVNFTPSIGSQIGSQDALMVNWHDTWVWRLASWNTRDLKIRQRRRPWKPHWKIDSASFQTISRLSQVDQLLKKEGNLRWSWREGAAHPSSERDGRIYRLAVPVLKKLIIGSFHVVVVHEQQKNVQKSVMYVKSCCFAN